MKIAIGCDPNAQFAKEELIQFIHAKRLGDVKDFGSETHLCSCGCGSCRSGSGEGV